MAYLVDIDRFQISMGSLEEVIEKDNPIRFVDAFVEHLDLSQRLESKLQESGLAFKNQPKSKQNKTNRRTHILDLQTSSLNQHLSKAFKTRTKESKMSLISVKS